MIMITAQNGISVNNESIKIASVQTCTQTFDELKEYVRNRLEF